MNNDDKRLQDAEPDVRDTQAALPGVPLPERSARPDTAAIGDAAAPEFDIACAPVPGQLPLPMTEDSPHLPAEQPQGANNAPLKSPSGNAVPDVVQEPAPYPFSVAVKPAPSPADPVPEPLEPDAALNAKPAEPVSASGPETARPVAKPAPTPAPTAPARPHFFALHPIQPTPSGMEPSFSSRIFDLMAHAPWLFLIVMLAAQTVFSLDSRALWFSDEVRHADAFRNLLEHGRGIVLQLNGQDYWDKPPLYFWFLRGIYAVIRVEGPLLYFTGTAVSALLYLLSFLLLGRFVDRADGRSLLASGIVLFCGGYVYALMHYARMDFLFSACIICSYAALYHALIRPRSFGFTLLAFTLGGIACLIKGPLGLALPLAAGLFFVFWRGNPQRFLRLDMLVGFLAACAVVAVWGVLVYLEKGSLDDLILEVWHKQILARAGNSFAHKEPFWFYVRLPLLLLPFSLVLFCLPWARLLSRAVPERFRFLRRPEGEGRAFLWCIALSALVLLSCLSGKILIYYLPALPAVALIAGRAILELTGFRAALFRRLTALSLILAGLGLFGAALVLFGALPAPEGLGLPLWRLAGSPAFYLAAFGFVAAGLFLVLVLRSSRPEGVLLGCALFLTVLSYPLARNVAPAFDAVLSPRGQSLIMKSWMDKGYLPFSYKNYPGIYAYYAGAPVTDIESLAELPPLPGERGVVLAIRRKDLNKWPGKPECFREVDARYIEHPERVLLVCPPAVPGSPAGMPSEEAPASGEDGPAPGATAPEAVPAPGDASGPATAPIVEPQEPSAPAPSEAVPDLEAGAAPEAESRP